MTDRNLPGHGFGDVGFGLWPPGGSGVVEPPSGTDVWELHDAGLWVVIPTNCERKRDGTAVMGAGLALAAAQRFPDVPARYGRSLEAGRTRIVVPDHRLLLAPTKTAWRQPATMALVVELLDAVGGWAAANPTQAVAVPSPGCGRGGLPWEQVRAQALARLGGARVALLGPVA